MKVFVACSCGAFKTYISKCNIFQANWIIDGLIEIALEQHPGATTEADQEHTLKTMLTYDDQSTDFIEAKQ